MENENKEVVKENKTSKKEIKSKKIKFIYYTVVFILSLIINYNFSIEPEINLGDFGSITPLLFSIIILQSLRWCPIFCIAGIVLTIFDEKFKDFNTVFLFVVGFLIVTSVILLFVL